MRGNNKKNVVLIADDDLFVRKVIISAISDLTEIVEVSDGAQVEQAYREHKPDIIFLDIHLPNVSGLELVYKLIKEDMAAYIVMLSADSSEENVLNSKLKGARGFLTKPFKKERIMHFFNACPTIKFADDKVGNG